MSDAKGRFGPVCPGPLQADDRGLRHDQDGIDFDVKYALDVSRVRDEVAVANKLTLDILRLCERLGIRAGDEQA